MRRVKPSSLISGRSRLFRHYPIRQSYIFDEDLKAGGLHVDVFLVHALDDFHSMVKCPFDLVWVDFLLVSFLHFVKQRQH